MSKSLPPEDLAWLRQCAAVDGNTYDRVLLHLLERVESLEARPIPGAVELAAPVTTDQELCNAYNNAPGHSFGPALRAVSDLGRQHGAAQPAPQPAQPNHEGGEYTDQEWAEIKRWRQESSSSQPAQPAPPAGGLVEMVVAATWLAEELPGEEYERAAIARVAIRYVAAWLDLQGQHGCSLLLREEADQ